MSNLPPITHLAGNHGTLFEGYFQQLDVTRNGRIDASSAAGFLKKSQLGDPVLHKIWELSDVGGKGYLDKQGFFAALRLVSACQSGKSPSLAVITLSDPPPRLVGMDSTSIAGLAQKKWIIEAEERARYDKMFQGLGPVSGKLTGEKARPVMMASKLPVDALGKIWNLSDIDRDGQLDGDEFTVAMRLIQLCQAGESLPPSLPASIIPLTKKGAGAGLGPVGALPPLAAPLHPSPCPSPIPLSASPTPPKKIEWVVNAEAKAKYDKYFEGIDKDRDGLVSGDEARGLFMASNLSSSILAHVWNLCDTLKRGKLNAEQFALAMFLIAEKVRGKELPNELSPIMIPPSVRGKSPPTVSQQMPSSASTSSLSSPASGAAPLSVFPTSSSSAPSLIPTPASSSSAGPSLLPTMTATPPPLLSSTASLLPTPVPSVGATTPPSGLGTSLAAAIAADAEAMGFANDFSAIKELDSIANEIGGIKTEKVRLQEDIRVKQEMIQTRKGEIENLQGEGGAYMKQREELERKKGQYTVQLELLDTEKAKAESQIAEMKQKCQDEQEEIERLKVQLSQQESSKRAQGEELERLQVQLETLKKEEREYKQKVEAGTAELEKLQKANQNRQFEIKEVRHKLDRFKDDQLQLNQQMSMYGAPGSTPGSTPSSSVININDVGQLSSELHVPHINEPDAISARATAGSSSPVSSISGFSTNSHLEDTGDDGGTGGGGGGSKDDKTSRGDPFAGMISASTTTSQASDPFAAFSVGGGDHFSSAGGASFKQSDLSAFDPFGIGDTSFKSTSTGAGGAGSGVAGGGGSIGKDIFRSDPFSSTAGSTSAAANTVSTDPFSGQDPFSSDPFASTGTTSSAGTSAAGKSTNTQSSWSGPSPFGSDPFNSGGGGTSGGGGGVQSVTTPTDPFSNDPFMEDPFGVKTSGGGNTNPFGSDAADAFGSGKGWGNAKTS